MSKGKDIIEVSWETRNFSEVRTLVTRNSGYLEKLGSNLKQKMNIEF